MNDEQYSNICETLSSLHKQLRWYITHVSDRFDALDRRLKNMAITLQAEEAALKLIDQSIQDQNTNLENITTAVNQLEAAFQAVKDEDPDQDLSDLDAVVQSLSSHVGAMSATQSALATNLSTVLASSTTATPAVPPTTTTTS